MEEEKPMRFLALIITIILVSGCSSMPQRIEVSAKPVDKPQLILPDAQKLNLRDVEFILITRENAEEVFAELERSRKDPVLIGLTDDGYETLSLNLSEVMALLQQQKAIIAAYENYYKNANEALDEANAEIDGVKSEVDSQQQKEGDDPFWKIF
jgi:hypothetical protein